MKRRIYRLLIAAGKDSSAGAEAGSLKYLKAKVYISRQTQFVNFMALTLFMVNFLPGLRQFSHLKAGNQQGFTGLKPGIKS